MGTKARRREPRGRPAAADEFPAGAEVEVRCEDEGFRDAWYEATVVRTPRNRRGYYVVYDSILTDEDPSKHLREFVRVTHVRPRPPPRFTAGARYIVHQLVDANHNDGWWAGVVSAVHGGQPPGRYTVCFPTSREVIEFVPSDLRPRLVWLSGEWRLPYDEVRARAKFAVGDQVEVSGDRENYGAAWFPAAIMRVISNTIFLVVYRTLKEDGGCELSREILDAQYIRPPPPCLPVAKQFELQNEVEAFHRCGWFVGVVSKILDDSRYFVKFKYRKEEMKFHHSKLRIRRDWILESWYHASRDKCQKRPSHASKISSLPISISTSSSIDEDSEAMYETPLKMMFSKLNKREGSSCEGQVKTLRPSKRRKEGDSSDHLGIELGPKTPIADTEGHDALPNLENPSSDFIAARTCISTGLTPCLSFEEVQDGQTSSKFNTKAQLLIKGEESSNFKHDRTQQSKASNFNHTHLATEWGNCKGVRAPRGDAFRRRKKLAVRGPRRRREVDDVVDVREHAKDGLKANGGSPTKESIIHTHAFVECMELQQLKRTTDLVVENGKRIEGVDLSSGVVPDDVSNGIQQPCLEDKVMICENSKLISYLNGDPPNSDIISIQVDKHVDMLEAHHIMPQIELLARGDTSVKYLTAPQLSNVISSPFNTSVQEMLNFADGLSDTGNEDEIQAPLMPFKEGNAVAISNSFNTRVKEVSSFCNQLNASGTENIALPSSLVEGSDVTYKNHTSSGSPSKRVSVEERVLIDPPPKGPSSMKTTLPFVKSSSLWESVESMEVFRIMPQPPHFRQLEIYSVEFREGMAIGLMVSFANLVANIRKLRISDSLASFEEIMNALFSFEANGFDVQCVRSRMEELLELRDHQRQFEIKKATLHGDIFERENKKDRLNALSAVFCETTRELERHLARFREEGDSVAVQQKNNESDIIRLQKDMKAAEEAYLSSERRFDTITASPWR